MASKIIVKIAKDGSTKIKVEGMKGKGCKSMTEDIEKALGAVKEDVKTNEFYQGGPEVTHVTTGH